MVVSSSVDMVIVETMLEAIEGVIKRAKVRGVIIVMCWLEGKVGCVATFF